TIASLSMVVTMADCKPLREQKSSRLFNSEGFSMYRLLHLISTHHLGFSLASSRLTRSTSPLLLPAFHRAYFRFIVSRCIHCPNKAVSTAFPASSSVGESGEKRAVRSDGFVR